MMKQIQILIKQEVSPIKSTDKDDNHLNETNLNSNNSDEYLSNDEGESFGLSERIKGKKLAHDQLKYIKNYI